MYRKTSCRYSVAFALAFILIAGAWVSSRGQQTTQQSQVDKTESDQKKASEDALVKGSRDAILRAGISPQYFDEHFKLFKVFDSPSDRRVMWRFSVNEYETIVQDSVGISTVGTDTHVTHTVTSILPSMAEIHKTIPRRQAERTLKNCIGHHETPGVELRLDESGNVGLFLTASAMQPSTPGSSQPATSPSTNPDIVAASEQRRDALRQRGKRRDPLVLGAVNLQSGKCIKGLGLVGPRPSKSK
jgi:hypothetical protein